MKNSSIELNKIKKLSEAGSHIVICKEKGKPWKILLKAEVNVKNLKKFKKVKAINSKHTSVLMEAIANKDAEIEYCLRGSARYNKAVNFIKYYDEKRKYRIKQKYVKPTILKDIKVNRLTTEEDFQTLLKIGIKEPEFAVSIIKFEGSIMRTVCKSKSGKIEFVALNTETMKSNKESFKFERVTKG